MRVRRCARIRGMALYYRRCGKSMRPRTRCRHAPLRSPACGKAAPPVTCPSLCPVEVHAWRFPLRCSRTSFPGVPDPKRGKVRDIYEATGDLLIVATDRISAFDYVLGSGIPDKGKVLNAALVVLVRPDRGRGAAITSSRWTPRGSRRPSTARGRAARALDARAPHQVRCRSSASCAAIWWGRAGRSTGRTASVCGIRLPGGLREADRLPEPIFTPSTKAETGHDINISRGRGGTTGRARRWSARLKALVARGLPRSAPPTPNRAASSSPTRSSSSACVERGRTAGRPAHRRGAHARLLALLAGGRVQAGRQPAELRQAVRARLPRADPLEQAAARARRCPTRWWRVRARNTSRRSAG